MLAHPLFANSKRYPALFRHVVECRLAGKTETLKERTLGIEVFGRKADYDTNLDPVVRITAGEIRKRIAQYYHEPDHESELRIDLPSGSYVPFFHLPQSLGSAGVGVVDDSDVPHTPEPAPPRLGRAARLWSPAWLASTCAFAAVVVAVFSIKPWNAKSPLDEFWSPILDAPGPVLLSIGEPSIANDQSRETGGNSQESISEHIRRVDHIVLPDVLALVNLSGFLGRAGKAYRLQGTSATTLTDLRQGPTILISAFDNPWTLRLTEPLRFHFVRQSGSSVCSIEDRDDPSGNRWSVDFSAPYSKLTEDYAIVGRFWDGITGQLLVIAAGISIHGTISAGEFLTDKRFLQEIRDRSPGESAHKNIEVVIATQVIDGKSGPPRVEAIHSW
jgi:hypothetical protein